MMRVLLTTALVLLALGAGACASSSAPPSGTAAATTSAAGGAGGAATASYGFVVTPMAIVPPTARTNGWVATALQADGRTGVGSDHFGRVERDRVVAENGQVLLQLSADGSFSLPWRTGDGPTFRLTAQGLEAVNNGTTTLITVNDQGEYSENGAATGARVTPYVPANRDTALLLRMLHALAFMHGMSTANAAGNTAVTPAH